MSGLPIAVDLDAARALRDRFWRGHRLVPPQYQAALDDCGLDRYFTPLDVAAACHRSMLDAMTADHAAVDEYTWIEPAAGDGAFVRLLPARPRRIAIDVAPMSMDTTAADFLSWSPPSGGRYAVIGNPPFGRYGWTALAFLNRAAEIADYIGFLLPTSFAAGDAGALRYRVRGAELVTSISHDDMAFRSADGAARRLSIPCVWQVWRRGVNNLRPRPTCDDYVDLLTIRLDIYGMRSRSQLDLDLGVEGGGDRMTARIAAADLFLQERFFPTSPIRIVRSMSDIAYDTAYGIVIKRDRAAVTAALAATDWTTYSNPATNRSRTVTRENICAALIDAGFRDPAPTETDSQGDSHDDANDSS